MSNGMESIIHYKNGAITIIEYPKYSIKSPVYTDLTMDDINKLYIGMPYEEAIEILGTPHRHDGEVALRHVYDLKDGSVIGVFYTYGAVSKITYWSPESKTETVFKN